MVEQKIPTPLRSPAIGEHRLLSSGRSAALIAPDGTIDWWCAPDYDSPPLLWSLLDPDGAAGRWPGARMLRRDGRPAGATTRTILAVGDDVRFECWDGLVATAEGGVALIRLVRRPSGDPTTTGVVTVVHRLELGGFELAAGRWEGPVVRWADREVTVSSGGSSTENYDGQLDTTMTLPADGSWASMAIAVDGVIGDDPATLADALQRAENLTSARAGRLRVPRHHPERARDAMAVLRACTFSSTGAIVASPTTSLPEAPGGDRQFDYRYTWLRDASLAVSVSSLLGDHDTAEKYLSFVESVVGDDGVPAAPLTDVRGHAVPTEREVEGVAGWSGSRPVRVGNAAAGQVQFDALGLVVEAISVYLQTGGRLRRSTWDLVRSIADKAAGDTPERTNGIWEFRDAAPLIDADIGRWLAVDRAIWIARGWRPQSRRATWKRARSQISDKVIAAIGTDGLLPQSYDDPSTPDAAALMAVIFGLLDGRRDPRAARLVDEVLRRLEAGPFLYRYPPGGGDGFVGREAAFVPVSWWAVSALAATGRLAEAEHRADALCAQLPRLMAEEFDPERAESLGNVPLVWSHMETARTMYLLDAASLRSRFGPVGLWTWRLGRFASLSAKRRKPRPDTVRSVVAGP